MTTKVPETLLDRWSSRHHQVKEAIENRIAQKEIELHALISEGGPQRKRQKRGLPRFNDPGRTAQQARFGRGDLGRLQAPGPRALRPVSADALLPALTELHATFTGREARAIVEQCTGASIDDVLAVLNQARAAGDVVALTEGRMTTRAQRAAEQRTLAAAEEIALDAGTPIPRRIVDAEIDRSRLCWLPTAAS